MSAGQDLESDEYMLHYIPLKRPKRHSLSTLAPLSMWGVTLSKSGEKQDNAIHNALEQLAYAFVPFCLDEVYNFGSSKVTAVIPTIVTTAKLFTLKPAVQTLESIRQANAPHEVADELPWTWCYYAAATIETYVKIISALYDKGSAYTNLVIVGGYAAFFALWTNSRPLININQARWAAILMLISASIFVIFEVYKMFHSAAHLVRYQNIFQTIENANNPDVINQAFREYEHAHNQRRNRLIVPWLIANCLAVPTALIAVLILLCGFISGLF